METPNSSYRASVSHEDPKDQPDTYGLYPAEWRRPSARETSEANQHRVRDTGGGLGLAGYDAEYLLGNPDQASRPLGAMAAAKTFEA